MCLSDLFSRPQDIDATDQRKEKKTIHIFLVGRDIQNCKLLSKNNKGGSTLIDKLSLLTHPSQLEAVQPLAINSRSYVVTRSMTRKTAEEQIREAEVVDDMEIYGSEESDSEPDIGTSQYTSNQQSLRPITRPAKQSLDVNRERMEAELRQHMVVADQSSLSQATMAHSIFHLPRTELVNQFGITKAQADDIVNSCSCSDALSTNRHPHHPSRSHNRPRGPGVEVSMDVIHMNNHAYLLVCRDMYSGLVRIEPLKNMTSDTVFTALLKLYRVEGLPIGFKSDGARYDKGVNCLSYHSTFIKCSF